MRNNYRENKQAKKQRSDTKMKQRNVSNYFQTSNKEKSNISQNIEKTNKTIEKTNYFAFMGNKYNFRLLYRLQYKVLITMVKFQGAYG